MARKLSPTQRLKNLGNTHKWFVGGGRRCIWAPEFPNHLDAPGFWDPGTYLEIPFAGLLTFALLDGDAELPWTQTKRDWQPDRLALDYDLPGVSITETRTVAADDVFTSELTLKNRTGKARTLDLVMWGRVTCSDDGTPKFVDCRARPTGVTGRYESVDTKGKPEHTLRLTWTLDQVRSKSKGCTSAAVMVSEKGGPGPDWKFSPFYETFDGKLPDVCQWEGGIDHRYGRPMEKFVFVALHQRIRLAARGSTTLRGGCQIAPAVGGKPKAAQIGGWDDFLAKTPVFQCSDPYFEKYYDYRWYGLRLNTVDAGEAPLRHPAVFEGINPGWFRHAISYSAQILPRDCRWHHDAALAQGNVLNFLENQRRDGFIHGGLLTGQTGRTRHTGHMYHSDWGGVVRAIHEIHPDKKFLRACYEPLTRYARYFDKQRDKKTTHLYDVLAQAETGQEYMTRYLFVDPKADEWGPIQLKGVDATVYIYELQRQLAWMADTLGKSGDAGKWQKAAAATAKAIRKKMWDKRRSKFCDVHPKNGKRSPVRALTDFYPFLTDIAGPEHVEALRKHLLDEKAFWTPFPAPSTALGDEGSDAYGRWLGKRKNCPWNGRTWLMTNSHIAEVLARATRTLDRRLERYATEFLRRYIYMLFADRDLDRPTSYEYYNPLTGQAPYFRGTEEYMHSWIIDLIIKHVVGLQPLADGTIVVEPLDFGFENFSLTNCRVAGKDIEIKWNGTTLSAQVGKQKLRVKGLGRLEF